MSGKIDFIAPGKNPGEVHLYAEGKLTIANQYPSSRKYIEDLCLKNGTTLEGSYTSSGYLLSGAYKRPIYIGGSCNQIFIPTSSIKSNRCVWMSLDYCLREPMAAFNRYGYEQMSERRWQKHVSDGIALKYAIFEKGQSQNAEDSH